MKFCTYQDNTVVLVCAKFHCDWTDKIENKKQMGFN